jgi:hypothetical protein
MCLIVSSLQTYNLASVCKYILVPISPFQSATKFLPPPVSFLGLGRESLEIPATGPCCCKFKWLLTNRKPVLLTISHNGGRRCFTKYWQKVNGTYSNTAGNVLNILWAKLTNATYKCTEGRVAWATRVRSRSKTKSHNRIYEGTNQTSRTNRF